MARRAVLVARRSAGLALLAVATMLLHGVHSDAADAALAYLLGVLVAAVAGGWWTGAATSGVAVAALWGLFVRPAQTRGPAGADAWFALGAFAVTAAVTTALVARAGARFRSAEAREFQARRLLRLSERMLGGAGEPADLAAPLEALAQACGEAMGARRALIRLWDPEGGGQMVPEAELGAWPASTLAAVGAACHRLPEAPLSWQDAEMGPVTVLPLARRSAQPALLVAAGARPQPDMAQAVAGLGSLALERLLLERQIFDAEAVRRSDALKSALLSSVSHELRTPLASIRLAATALQRPDTWADPEGRVDLLRAVDAEAERLNRVIANLLCLSRIEAGALQPDRRPCEVAALVFEAVRQAGPRLDPARLQLEVPEDLPAVDCDLGLAALALANILDNAVKYAPAGTPVTLGARQAPGGRLVAIWVDDRGPGVRPAEAERIFERFYRAVPQGDRTPGTGVGLSIARALVEAHDGRVWVEARPGGGSRFTTTWASAEGGRAAAAR